MDRDKVRDEVHVKVTGYLSDTKVNIEWPQSAITTTSYTVASRLVVRDCSLFMFQVAPRMYKGWARRLSAEEAPP